MTVDEAIGVIEPYLISMYNENGNKTIKIVHGKGTMALAKGLHAYFRSSPIVAEFRFGRYGEGDNGITFVTVK
jgi:DNA mismatch repair protein MutS2